MSTNILSNSDLRNRSDAERSRMISEFLHSEPASQEDALASIDRALAYLENKYGMKSEVMRQLIEAGTLRETDDYCHWLMLVSIRNRVAHAPERSG